MILEDDNTVYQIDRMRSDSYFGNRSVIVKRDGYNLILEADEDKLKFQEGFFQKLFKDSDIQPSWENIPVKMVSDILSLPLLGQENVLLDSIFNSKGTNQNWRDSITQLIEISRNGNISIEKYTSLLKRLRSLALHIQYHRIENNISNYLSTIIGYMRGDLDNYVPSLRQKSE